jgi:hypothetical protein
MGRNLIRKVSQNGEERVRSYLTQAAPGRIGEHGAKFLDAGFRASASAKVEEPVELLEEGRRAQAAGVTGAARLFGEEAGLAPREVEEAVAGPDDHDGPRAEISPLRAEGGNLERDVELFRRQESTGRTPNEKGLQGLRSPKTAAVSEDQLASGQASRKLVVPGTADITREAVDLDSGGAASPKPTVPGGTSLENRRHRRQRLHIVHQGGAA